MTTRRRARSIDLDNSFAPLDDICELVLVRHGEQVLGEDIKTGDLIDPPLSELGERQVQAVAARVAEMKIDAVYSSPLRRALDTATAIGRPHGLTPVLRTELCEYVVWHDFPQDKSAYDVLPREEVSRIFRDFARTKNFAAFRYGEDRVAFRARIVDTIAGIVDRHRGHRVVVACHSAVINAVLAQALATEMDSAVRLHHTSLTVVRAADTRRAIISVNDFTHVLAFQDHLGAANR